MKKTVIIGHSGLLGSWVKQVLSDYKPICVAQRSDDGEQVDMSDPLAAAAFFQKHQPEVIINLAAYTNVDICETEPEKAYRVNVGINQNIADFLCRSNGAFCVLISTDHVYDSPNLNKEENTILRNHYARTKKQGEEALPLNKSVILRTNFFGRSVSTQKQSFTDWLYQSLQSGQKIQLFTDSYFSPLHGLDLARYIRKVVEQPQFGLFNLGSHNGMSKADFAVEFFNLFKPKAANFVRVKYADLPGKISRPMGMQMDVTRFERAYHVQLPKLIDQIRQCYGEYHA